MPSAILAAVVLIAFTTLPDPEDVYKRQAEERALDLMMESYIFRSYPVPMTQTLLKNLMDEVKSQGTHIKRVTELIKNPIKK